MKEYKIEIDPRILELLGPSLYTNIYYVLAELIANAYDADARNVYIINNKNNITVEDDGKGMSYKNKEIDKYLGVAAISRTSEEDSFTSEMKRRKMGRKGVGKLAALSVSENVTVKTIAEGEKSGFILSRKVGDDKKLKALHEDEIIFERIDEHGTSIVMDNPMYKLHTSLGAVKRNLLKIFPLVDNDFVIHLIKGNEIETIADFDKTMISELSSLITIGDEFSYLAETFKTPFEKNLNDLCINRETVSIPIKMPDLAGGSSEHNMEIKGWIGTYASTRGRKITLADFPDNFISIYANKKMGEFNILPTIGQNKLAEVYIVGQLHVDIFELTELPDMALSNRQGYKTEDPRYQALLEYARKDLLPSVLKMRLLAVSLKNKQKQDTKLSKESKKEAEFRKAVERFKNRTSKEAAKKISKTFGISSKLQKQEITNILVNEINTNSGSIGIKNKIDSQKKKILISQTYDDKDLSDVVYTMLKFNNVPAEDIIFSNCDDEVSRIPEGRNGESGIYDYLRKFFVDSYSDQKIFVIFITSHASKVKWGAVTEVGAAWITQAEHKIFTIFDHVPEHPLDVTQTYHVSRRQHDGTLCMDNLAVDIFAAKIEYICTYLGYSHKTREENTNQIQSLVSLIK